jgi:hypothetical protein
VTQILLIGAGFTYNWGGWLAGEIEGDLLSRFPHNPELNARVNATDGFESVLGDLQRERDEGKPGAKEQYDVLKQAVLESFGAMNLALARRIDFEFLNQVRFSVKRFLARFHSIYSLNQDLLLELHYDPQLQETRLPGRGGAYYPGLHGPINKSMWPEEQIHQKKTVMARPIQYHSNHQPIFKLHGSVDWLDADGDLLVMGGGKQEMIERTPLLNEYFANFKRELSQPGARLMVIGYGFRDSHINNLLAEAWQANSSLSAFYVDPKGRKVVYGGDHTELPQYTPPWGWVTAIGESRRPLSQTFAGDELELAKLERFFTR